jgi:hypothetical protein
MNELVGAINGVIWSPALIFLCLGVGLYFSLRSRFLQLRHIKHMITLMFQGRPTDAGVSSFQALTMTLAGRVGTGTLLVSPPQSPSVDRAHFSGCGWWRFWVPAQRLWNLRWARFIKKKSTVNIVAVLPFISKKD